MHFTLLLVSKVTSVHHTNKISQLMWPFQEVWDEDDIRTEFFEDEKYPEDSYWGNPESKWDWYSIGGRWSCRIDAKRGKVGTSAGVPGKGYDLAYIDDLRSIDPDDWYSVLLPDGSWHDRELYVKPKDGETFGRFEPNAEWDDFERLFIDPYRGQGYTVMTIDYHD